MTPAVVSQQSGSSTIRRMASDGWFSGTYDAAINANTTRTFTVSTSDGTFILQNPAIFRLSGYTEVWIVSGGSSVTVIQKIRLPNLIAAALSSASGGPRPASSSRSAFYEIVRFSMDETTSEHVIGTDTTKMTGGQGYLRLVSSKVPPASYDVILCPDRRGGGLYRVRPFHGLQIALDSIWAVSISSG